MTWNVELVRFVLELFIFFLEFSDSFWEVLLVAKARSACTCLISPNVVIMLILFSGASGAIFGIFALTLLDVFYTWNERLSPGKDLGFLILDMAISFVLGLLPFIDNFAHIGGFVAGLACGVVFLRTPKTIARRLGQDDPPYTKATSTNRYNSSTGDSDLSGFRGFFKNPVGFFKGRKTAWWLWWFVRAFVLTMILVGVIVMLDSFYKKDDVCKWCRFLNCLQVRDWCEMDDLKFTNTKTSANTARMLVRSLPVAAVAEFL